MYVNKNWPKNPTHRDLQRIADAERKRIRKNTKRIKNNKGRKQ